MINCFCFYVNKSAGEIASSVIGRLKSTANRNKSFKLGHWTLNARKYVRCARAFYFVLEQSVAESSVASFVRPDFRGDKTQHTRSQGVYVCLYI